MFKNPLRPSQRRTAIHGKLLLAPVIFLLTTGISFTQSNNAERLLRQKVDRLLEQPLFKRTFAGIEISELRTGRILYERNSAYFFRPASTTKLFTTAAAVLALPDTFSFMTRVLGLLESKGEASVWLQGAGDPLFQPEDIQILVNGILRSGVRRMTRLTLDRGSFDTTFFGSGWMWDDEGSSFTPYLSSFPIARNRVSVTVTGGGRTGDTVIVTTQPESAVFTVTNRARTGAGPALSVTRLPRGNEIVVDGFVPPATTKTESVSMWKPELLFADLFLRECRRSGIEVPDTFSFGTIPAGAVELSIVARPLQPVLNMTNKSSDNLCAEMLLRILSGNQSGTGTMEGGIAVMKRTLVKIGVPSDEVALVDGSGISFYNLVTPAAAGALLRGMARRPSFERFKQSLAIAGKDGTLSSRMKQLSRTDAVFGKTGTVRGVSALAGYVLPPKGPELSFVMFMQDFLGEHAPYRAVQDEVVRACLEYSTR